MQNMVVVHFPGGTLLKGVTNNFFPNKSKFHVTEKDSGEIREVLLSELKAVFFVKCFQGNSGYQDRTDVERTGLGKKLRVDFLDGETLTGYSQGYSPGRPGFFLFPSDPMSNNDRVFVLASAIKAAVVV
jgi:hypothetical protein